MIILYGLKNCDKCRAAKKQLEAVGTEGADFTFYDLRERGISAADIKRWLKQVDMEVLFNKRSTTYRGLSAADKNKSSEKDLIALMVANPTLLKRPIVEEGGKIKVG